MKLKNITRIPIPIPIPALKIVNSYILSENDDLLIIDTGMPVRSSIGYLEEKLIENGFRLRDIKRILVTHLHIDHIGGAGYIQRVSKALFSMHEKEVKMIKDMINYPDDSTETFRKIMYRSGVPNKMVEKMMFFHPGISNHALYADINYNATVKENDIIKLGKRKLRVVSTPGHSINHICIYDAENKILFSGDHILPKITPNIRVPLGGDNPLGEYLDSLDKISKLEVRYYLPGHGDPQPDVNRRIKELKCHHYERLLETIEIISDSGKSLSAYELASRMKWDIKIPWEDFPTTQKYFAMGEALAHIHYLQENKMIKGAVERDIEKFMVLPIKNEFEEMLKEKVCFPS